MAAKRGILRLISFILAVNIFHACYCQQASEKNKFGYTLPLQRLHLKLVGTYLYFMMQGQLDSDSAAILASEGQDIPYELYYNEDYAAGSEGKIKSLLNYASQMIYKAGNKEEDLTLAFSYLQQAQTLITPTSDPYWKHAFHSIFGKYYFQRGENKKSSEHFTSALEAARSGQSPELLIQAFANRGIFSDYSNTSKETDLNEALKLARRSNNKIKEIELLTAIEEIYFIQSRPDTAKSMLLQITDIEKSIGFKHLHYNYNVLSFLAANSADNYGTFNYASLSVKTMETLQDFSFANFIYGYMAGTYSYFDNSELALYWYKKSIEVQSMPKAKRIWFSHFLATSINMSKEGYVQEALETVLPVIKQFPPESEHEKMITYNFLASAYDVLGNKKLARENYLNALQHIVPATPINMLAIFACYADVSEFFTNSGAIQSGRKYLNLAKQHYQPGNLGVDARMARISFKADSAEGNYFSALKHYQYSRILEDSFFRSKKRRRISELEVQYETKNKDRDIEVLTERSRIQKVNLQQAEAIRTYILAGIGLLALITALIYILYRNNKKNSIKIAQKNKVLETLVKEKDWLVKEIHHRVKNNLQTIVSLLESQSRNLKSEALEAVQDSRNRIYTMSLIHQKLYQKDISSSVNMRDFICELIENLKNSFDTSQHIRFEQVIDNIVLDISQATPIGLILNESIINSIKYAFEGREQKKEIQVSMTRQPDGNILFEISDNGKGLPKDYKIKAESSLGIRLITGLTHELHGTLTFDLSQGTKIIILFTPKLVSFNIPA
jgi:two-component system, sensor histidine kinase PdtaS